MNKLGVGFLLMVLVFAPVMPLTASPDPDSATGTPTPTVSDHTGQVPVWGTDSGAVPMTAVDGVLGHPGGVFNPRVLDGDPDPQAMEEFRRELLDFLAVLEDLYPCAEYVAQLKGEEPPPLVSPKVIQQLTHEELYMMREMFGETYEPFRETVKLLRSLDLTPAKESSEGAEGTGPSPDSFTMISASSSPPLTSIGIIPAPTPVTTPPPGIVHDTSAKRTLVQQINAAAGDLATPNYPTSVGCPEERFENWLMLTLLVGKSVADALSLAAEIIGCEGGVVVVALPFGGGTNIVQCMLYGVAKGLAAVAGFIYDGFSFCINRIDAAELEAGRKNVRIIHADLADHDQDLTTRFNWTDNFLFHFRNLNLRSRIEANLASPEDDPISLFTLPSDICITTDLEVFDRSDPGAQFSAERIAGCGLLEVVSDTVQSAINMTESAEESVNNAWAEFDAAVEHYNNHEWKLSYARFRKAYREAVRP